MNTEKLGGNCPVCGKGPLVALPIGYKVLAVKSAQAQPVGGLLAYQCSIEGHVFFVMARDVDVA